MDDDSDGAASFNHAFTLGGETVTYADTIPDNEDERLQGTSAVNQNFPGDVSIMQVSYENGMMKAIETAGGGVETDHHLNANGEGGTETVRNNVTGAETFVHYDGDNRVTQQIDPYGAITQYAYDESAEANIKGALLEETDALGVKTAYDYPDFAAAYNDPTRYSSFSDMFSNYVNGQIGSDMDQPGYMTGSQGGPKTITQDDGGSNETAMTLTYFGETGGEIDHPAVFQPKTVTAPGNNVTTLDYDASSGQMTNVSFKANGNDGAQVTNEYYVENDTDLIYGGAALNATSPLIGKLKRITSRANPSAAERVTEYGYNHVYDADGTFLIREQSVREIRTNLPDITTYSAYDALGNLLWNQTQGGINHIRLLMAKVDC